MLLTQQQGILKPFALILGYIMEGIFKVLGFFSEYPNVGVAIILFTIIIYVLLLPLTIKQQKFAKLSNKMNPELQAIQAKYKGKNDQESMMKMQTETQAVYAKYGTSPSGSCVQLLIQMPILFALYRVIYNMPAYVARIKEAYYPLVADLAAEAKSGFLGHFLQSFSAYGRFAKQFAAESFTSGSVETQNTLIDLLNSSNSTDWDKLTMAYQSSPSILEGINKTRDALDHYNNFFGLNIANSPSSVVHEKLAEGNMLAVIGVLMIPVLAALTQWINTKLMPQPENNNKQNEDNSMAQSMKTMNAIMPIMSMFFCYSLPIGMGIYWIAGSVVRSIIQIAVNKHLDTIDVDEMIKQNVEKVNEKRRKAGLPPQQISANATVNARKVESKAEKTVEDKAKRAQNIKDSTDYYNKNAEKPGSLASKAAMVKKFNEKNNKD
ncbi:MAG: YidC/Oxa1 family membrane protein insertase [Lachnospiraceae bacterium]|nr:YidC/Oxa1 family membrane protein insertase [Lachnospiraceae bacterium]